MNKKRIVAIIAAAAVTAGGIVGISAGVRLSSASTVMVISGSELNSYWGGSYGNTLSGNVTTDAAQDVYLTDTDTVQEVLVKEGDTVRMGDTLLIYDTTKTSIALEQQKLTRDSIQLNIDIANKNLDTLSKLKPVSGGGDDPGYDPGIDDPGFDPGIDDPGYDPGIDDPGFDPGEDPGGEEPENPYSDAIYYGVGTVLGKSAVPFNGQEENAGTKENPYRFLCGEKVELTSAFIKLMEGNKAESFQLENYADNKVAGEPKYKMTFDVEDFKAMLNKDEDNNRILADLAENKIYNSVLNSQAVTLSEAEGTKKEPVEYYVLNGHKLTKSFLETLAKEAAEKPYVKIIIADLYGDDINEEEPDKIKTNELLFKATGLSPSTLADSWYLKLTQETKAEEIPGAITEEQETTPTPKPTEEPKPTQTPEPTGEPQPTETPKPTSEPEPTETPEPTKAPEPTVAPEVTETPQTGETTETGQTSKVNYKVKKLNGLYVDRAVLTAFSNALDGEGSTGGSGGAGGALIQPTAQYSKEEIAALKKENEAQLKTLNLDLKEANLKIAQTEKALSEGRVTAKMDGVIKKVGDPKNPPQDGSAFLQLTGESGIYVKGGLPESMIGKVKEGASVLVNAWESGTMCNAVIKTISEIPDTSGNYGYGSNQSYYTFTAYISEGGDNLRNNEYVDMTIQSMAEDEPIDDGSAFYLNKAFIRDDGAEKYVYIRDENGKLKKQVVETGAVSGDGIEILSGASMEDWYAFPYGKDVKAGAATKEGTMNELYEMA